MVDPTPTAPTPELEQESLQGELDREQRPEPGDPDAAARTEVCRALPETGALRAGDLAKAVAFEGDAAEWKRRLWRLHNEGYVKVRWVGLADPDPVEARLTERGREWLERAARAGSAGGGSPRG
jgi:hypothetical protein